MLYAIQPKSVYIYTNSVDKNLAKDFKYIIEHHNEYNASIITHDDLACKIIISKNTIENIETVEWENEPKGVFGNKNYIVAKGVDHNDLNFQFYSFINKLGVRWYFPTDHWVFIPQNLSLFKENTAYIFGADLPMRDFWGTGSAKFKIGSYVDSTEHKLWQKWYTRNRFNEPFKIPGHSWNEFVGNKKEILKNHPEYFAEYNGKRGKLHINRKLCVSNEDLVKLFVEERLETFKKRLRENPQENTIGVDPSDGSRFCTCAECNHKFGAENNVSNQVYYLANQVAKAFQKQHPDVKVILYAYHEHANPPDFDLEPNIYPVIIPFQFAKGTQTGAGLIETWSKKVENYSLYTYWALPDFYFDTPKYSISDFKKEFYPLIQYGAEGFQAQTTYSIGNGALHLFLANQIAIDTNLNIDQLFDKYLVDMFGDYANEMKQYYLVWDNGFNLTTKLDYANNIIKSLLERTETNDVRYKRLSDLKDYMTFLALYNSYKTETNEAIQEQKKNNLINFLFQTKNKLIVNANYLSVLLDKNRNKKIKAFAPVTDKNIEEVMNQLYPVTNVKPIDQKNSNIVSQFEYIPHWNKGLTQQNNSLVLFNKNTFYINKNKEVSFSIKPSDRNKEIKPIMISCYNENGILLLEKSISEATQITTPVGCTEVTIDASKSVTDFNVYEGTNHIYYEPRLWIIDSGTLFNIRVGDKLSTIIFTLKKPETIKSIRFYADSGNQLYPKKIGSHQFIIDLPPNTKHLFFNKPFINFTNTSPNVFFDLLPNNQ